MKKITIFILLSISVSIIGLLSYNELNSNINATEYKEENDKTIEIGATFMADFDNKQILAGSVDYIFTGEVIQKLGETDGFAYPTTQFEVKVNNQLQGQLPAKELTINQYGGHLTEEVDGETIKTLYLFEGDSLIEPKNEYVFAANKQQDGSILLIPSYGNTKIETNSLSKSNIVDEFKEAVKNPIVPDLQQKINEKNK